MNFYQLHPLYTKELEFKRKHGTETLLDCFDEWENDFFGCVSVVHPMVCRVRK